MKNKFLSLALSVVMLFGVFAVGAYAEEEAENTGKYTSDIELIKNLGMLEAFGGEVFEESRELTKAEFVSILTPILRPESPTSSNSSVPFPDVNEDTEYFEYICAAYEANAITGDGINFQPLKKISYTETVRILVDVLGYNAVVDMYGGYPGGYLKVASDIKLTKGVTLRGDESISFGEAAALIVNALNTNVYEISINGDKFEVGESSRTLLEEKRNIYRGYGILSENTYSSLENIDGNGIEGRLTIGDFTGTIYKSMLPEKYFGYYVEYYYDEDDNSILHIYPDENRNDVIKVLDVEIESFEFSDRNLKYTQNGRTYKETIPRDAIVIYNGKNKPVYTEEDLMPENGDVTLIDNDRDGDIEVVSVNSYTTVFVGTVDIEDEIIVDYYDTDVRLELSDDEADRSVIFTDESSNMLSIDQIAVNNVITALVSDDGKYIRGIVSDNSIEGKVTSINNDDDMLYITLDGTRYNINESFEDRCREVMKNGSNGTFYLDINGRICGFISMASFTEYGFYIKAYQDELEDIYVKLMNISGDFVTYKASEKLRIDGISITQINKDEETPVNKIDKLPTESQVIRYTINSLGELRTIDTAERTASESDDSLNSILGNSFVNQKFYNAYKSFRGKVWVDDKTVFIVAPTNPQGTSESDYSMGNYSLLNDTNYDFKAYNTSKDSVIPDIIHVNASGGEEKELTSSSYDGILLSLSDGLNADDEIVKIATIRTFDEGEQEYEVISNASTEGPLQKMSAGDYVLFNTNSRGQITNIDSVMYTKDINLYAPNASDNENKESDISSVLGEGTSFFSSSFEIQTGYVYNKEGDSFGVIDQYPSSTALDLSQRNIYRNVTTGNRPTQIFVVDTERTKGSERVREADWSELRDYLRYGAPDLVLCKFVHTELRTLVIYR